MKNIKQILEKLMLPRQQVTKRKQIDWASYEDFGYRKIGDNVPDFLPTEE